MNAPAKFSDVAPLSRKEAAIYLTTIGCPISPGTLANLAADDNARGGPPFTKVRQKRVWYSREDLAAWAKRQSVKVA
jgi:hypothetical protein